jgi:hypothetical protein
MPPGVPSGFSQQCPAPGCTFVISHESETKLLAELQNLSITQASARDLKHLNLHFGTKIGKLKLLWNDHVKRQLSLLHLILNATSSTLAIAVKAGASKAQLVACNAVFANYEVHFEYTLKKGDRDKKANGNVCRRMLWTPGVFRELLDARYGKPVHGKAAAASRVAARDMKAAQEAGECLDDSEPPSARARVPVRDTLDMDGIDMASLLAASAPPAAAPPAPPPPTTTTPEPTATTTTAADDDDPDGDDYGCDVGVSMADEYVEEVSDDTGDRNRMRARTVESRA